MNREVVGRAKYVKVHIPFKKSRWQWQYDGEGGSIRLWDPGCPGAVVLSPGYCLDLQTGEVYKDHRFDSLTKEEIYERPCCSK